MEFQRRRPTAGLAMALGSLEVHPLDLNQAYATLANGGRDLGVTSILQVTNTDGEEVLPPYTPPKGERAISDQAAYVVTDILAGNTDPAVNPIWAASRITTPSGQRRPAALKTGTNNDAKDLNAYGYIAPPSARGRQRGEYALSVGVWAGNSDTSPVTTVANPVFSLDVAAPIWDAFLSEVTRGWEVRDFARPEGLTTARRGRLHGLRTLTVVARADQRVLPARHGARRGPLPARPAGRARTGRRHVPLGGGLPGAAAHARLPGPRRRGVGLPELERGRPGLDQAGPPGTRRRCQRVEHEAHLHGLLLRALLPALRSDLGRPLRAHALLQPGALGQPQRLAVGHPPCHRRHHRCRRRSPPRRRRLPPSHPSPRPSPRRSPRSGHSRPPSPRRSRPTPSRPPSRRRSRRPRPSRQHRRPSRPASHRSGSPASPRPTSQAWPPRPRRPAAVASAAP